MSRDGFLLVRATVNLPGLRAGYYAYVDPEDDYMRGLLAANLLVEAEEKAPLDADASDLV